MILGTLKKIFTRITHKKLKGLVENGAQIIDVRPKKEFGFGYIEESINIPLNELKNNLRNVKKDHVIITCSENGDKSASAKVILKKMGHQKVYNAGPWLDLYKAI